MSVAPSSPLSSAVSSPPLPAGTDELGERAPDASGPAMRPLSEMGSELLASLLELKDADGLQLAHSFLELPDRETDPDYFNKISHPICLNQIWEKLISDDPYKSLGAIKSDLNCTFLNAQKYHKKGSLMYDAAAKLKRVFKAKSESLQSELDAALRPFQVVRPTRRRSDLAADDDDAGSEAGPSSLSSKKIKLTELPGSNRFWAYVPVSDEDQSSKASFPLPDPGPRQSKRVVDLERQVTELNKQLADGKRQVKKKDAAFAKIQADPSVSLLWPEERKTLTERQERVEQKTKEAEIEYRSSEKDLQTSLDAANERVERLGQENTALQFVLNASHQTVAELERKIEAGGAAQTDNATTEGDTKTADGSMTAITEGPTASPLKDDGDSKAETDSSAHPSTATSQNLRPHTSLEGDTKPLVHASAGLLEAILPAYESLVCELQTLKGKGAKDEEAVRYLRNLLPEFGALKDLMAKRKRRA